MMKRIDRVMREEEERFYPIFNEFQVVNKKKKVSCELHFVVPWEIMEETTKKFIH